MIPPDAQRTMGSHAVYVSQPQAVASLIEEAAIGSPFLREVTHLVLEVVITPPCTTSTGPAPKP